MYRKSIITSLSLPVKSVNVLPDKAFFFTEEKAAREFSHKKATAPDEKMIFVRGSCPFPSGETKEGL